MEDWAVEQHLYMERNEEARQQLQLLSDELEQAKVNLIECNRQRIDAT